jgi:Ammonium Transporter Family
MHVEYGLCYRAASAWGPRTVVLAFKSRYSRKYLCQQSVSSQTTMQNYNLPWVLGGIQILLLALIFGCTTYPDDIDSGYSLGEYGVFRDIMVMLLLGFGYLMTFLRKYGLGAVGFTLMLTALSMQLNILVEFLMRYLKESSAVEFPHPIHLYTLVDAEFAAATLLISFGAIIGRASPLQLIVLALMQSFFYALNKVILVLGIFKAEDVGGTITIHMVSAGKCVSPILCHFFPLLTCHFPASPSLEPILGWPCPVSLESPKAAARETLTQVSFPMCYV